MSVCGRKAFKIARSLCAPAKVTTKKYTSEYSEVLKYTVRCANFLAVISTRSPARSSSDSTSTTRLQKPCESISELEERLTKAREEVALCDSLNRTQLDKEVLQQECVESGM